MFNKCFTALIICLSGSAISLGQPSYELQFVRSSDGQLRWIAGFALTTIAPNGTEVSFGGGESFTSFDEFQEAVVGQWTLRDFALNEATFELLPFEEGGFPSDVELLNPVDGQDVVSGFPINYQVVSQQAEDGIGIGVSFNNNEIEVDFEPGQIMFLTLMPGVNKSFPLVRGRGINRVDGLVDAIDNMSSSLSISNRVQFVGESPIAVVRVVPQPIVGDVNLDGSVDLLDVVPFVQILSSGGFQFEADIDGNGVVDLLDVNPFVQLLL